MMRRCLFVSLAVLLAACAEGDGAPSAIDAQDRPPNADLSETIGGDGSALVLAELDQADVAGLEGELACSFTPEGAAGPTLIARANVDPGARSLAVVRIGAYVERLMSRAEGGYDAMVDGTSYGGRGLTVEITRLSEDNLNTVGEGLDYAATLRADRADGAQRTWPGVWSCGP